MSDTASVAGMPWWLLFVVGFASADYPPYYLSEIQAVLRLSDGSGLSSLDTRAVFALTQQVYCVYFVYALCVF